MFTMIIGLALKAEKDSVMKCTYDSLYLHIVLVDHLLESKKQFKHLKKQ